MLFIGPYQKFSDNVGGAVVYFTELYNYTSKKIDTVELIDINYYKKSMFLVFIKSMVDIFRKSKDHNKVILFSNTMGIILFGTILVLLKKVRLIRSFSLRPFGGGWNNYRQYGFFKRSMIKFVFKNCDYLFFQTKNEVKNFKLMNKSTRLLNNARLQQRFIRINDHNTIRCIYLGRVTHEKGIDLLIKLSNILYNTNITIDIYGSLHGYKIKNIEVNENIRYKGILDYKEVPKVIATYDYLLFPSNFIGEGYPGVIIESFIQGTPVLATHNENIAELVTNNYNGYILSPNVNSFYSILIKHSDEIHKKLVNNAYITANNYSIEKVFDDFISIVQN